MELHKKQFSSKLIYDGQIICEIDPRSKFGNSGLNGWQVVLRTHTHTRTDTDTQKQTDAVNDTTRPKVKSKYTNTVSFHEIVKKMRELISYAPVTFDHDTPPLNRKSVPTSLTCNHSV